MSPAGRKPRTPANHSAKPATRRLHPLRSYTTHDSLRDLVLAHFGHDWTGHYYQGALIQDVRDALNTALAPHGLRIGIEDVFFTNAAYDDDSDLVIGQALMDLDITALEARHRITAPA